MKQALMKMLRFFLLFLACGMTADLSAHPVAQGALAVRVQPDKIQVQARVSGEEVFVANTFTATHEPKAQTLAEVWQRHGDYLLRHLKVFADDTRLTGVVRGAVASTNDFVTYQLEFPVARSCARLRIEEDLLNEIEYAPGNPWEAAFIVRLEMPGRPPEEGLLLSRQQPLLISCGGPEVAVSASRGRMVQQYVRHGIGHILGGYDHLLFVAALVLGAATFWDLLKVVTAFTLAHTVTLALSVLNIVRLPSGLVEPMIAASIVFVSVTNLFWPKSSRGWMRLGTAFFFGLFHGLGFAGGLISATEGMNGAAILVAIAAFSLGVELGHQMVVLPLFAGLKLARQFRSDAPARERFSLLLVRGGSLLIAVAGTVYLVAALRSNGG